MGVGSVQSSGVSKTWPDLTRARPITVLGSQSRSGRRTRDCLVLSPFATMPLHCQGAGPYARFGFGCLISLLMPAPRSRCLDLGKSVVTSLRMSRSWKECCHLAPDVSILERVSVMGLGCIREGCMSCVVMSTYVSIRKKNVRPDAQAAS